MLTRLKVSGFKNLVGVDARFGPFTCVAGANAVGKSNLFDAIKFLSALANDTLIDAALSVRDEEGRTTNVRSLFHQVGDEYAEQMSFEAEMIIPREGVDDLGQRAEATITFLRYTVVLAYRVDESLPSLGALKLIREDLERIKIGDASKHLRFPHKASGDWRKSVVLGKRRAAPFISTDNQQIKLHQDGARGRPKSFLAANLPRTVLSTVNAAESPTALLARRELQSWRLLQLEPSALREPDRFTTPPGLGADGSHLAATLYYLARSRQHTDRVSGGEATTWVYDQIAARLSELIDDVYAVSVDRDERSELLTLEITDRSGTVQPARSLSDGTLRFLALAVLELDPRAGGLVCLEEPENGIHPARIPAMLQLLQDIAADVDSPIGPDNPLRQVIVNTHSPAVVMQVPDASLLVAELKEMVQDDRRFKGARFSWLPGTWRQDADPDVHPVTRGKLLVYLNPVSSMNQLSELKRGRPAHTVRVIDRPDVQEMLPLFQRGK
jgi:predicted ATPase